MPYYEYKCSSCNHQMTVSQKMSDEPLVHCPNCKQDTLVKQISISGFTLKGTGLFGKSKDYNKAPTSCACNGCPHNK